MDQPTPDELRNAAFTKTWLRPGYDIAEVHSFLRTAADRLASGRPAIGPDNTPSFNVRRLGEGYDEQEVDELLAKLEPQDNAVPAYDTLQPVTVDQIRNASFSTTLFRIGYAKDEVDQLLEKSARRVSAGQPPLSPDDTIAFNTTRLGEGYDEQEVDEFLNVLYKASGMPPR